MRFSTLPKNYHQNVNINVLPHITLHRPVYTGNFVFNIVNQSLKMNLEVVEPVSSTGISDIKANEDIKGSEDINPGEIEVI